MGFNLHIGLPGPISYNRRLGNGRRGNVIRGRRLFATAKWTCYLVGLVAVLSFALAFWRVELALGLLLAYAWIVGRIGGRG